MKKADIREVDYTFSSVFGETRSLYYSALFLITNLKPSP